MGRRPSKSLAQPTAAEGSCYLAAERKKTQRWRPFSCSGASGRSAAWVGSALLAGLLACHPPLPSPSTRIHLAPAPGSGAELPCAWFGDSDGGVLYFGVSAFWSALRATGGDATADLAASGPRWIGRFDLASERFLPPLELRPGGAATGVWDVLVHPNGRVYFTTYFDFAGSVDPESGAVREFASAGLGLNELALGPAGQILVTRYGFADDDEGSLVVLSESGEILAEHVLAASPNLRVLAKSLAFDPLRREAWLNTDLLPPGGGAALHDARVLDAAGHERRRISDPELQFFAFTADGTGLFAEVSERRLRLRQRSPEGRDRFIALDDAFDPTYDFVQDMRAAPDGSVVLTRWSGRIHLVEKDGEVRDLSLPRTEAGELYYTATRAFGHVCATRCGRVEVVCQDLPDS